MNINSWLQSFWPRVRQSMVISGRQRLQTQSHPVGFFHTCFTSSPPTQTGRKTHTDSTLFVDVHLCLFFFSFFLPNGRGIWFFSSHLIFFSCFSNARASNFQFISRNENWELKPHLRGVSDFTKTPDSESSHLRSVTCLWSARTRCRLTRRCFMGWGETLNRSVSAPLPPSFQWLTGSIMRRKVRWIYVKCQGPSGRHCKNSLLVSCSECRVVLSLIQCVCPPSPQGDVDRK